MFLNMRSSYVCIATAVMEITMYEKDKLDAVKYSIYPATCMYMHVTHTSIQVWVSSYIK